ncbi:MAG: hypothetical protein LBV52_03485 [Spirochaetaceae bacterium]|jgi:hypothetical protein|nr:hypothetical protein [Spirochaetaceae bacterium]
MPSLKKILVLAFIFALSGTALFAQTTVKGRLLKASYTGLDTTNLYEPLVTIKQSETLGVKYLSLELSGIKKRDNKYYEFYNDGTAPSPLIWKRRMRGVVVEPLNVVIALSGGFNGSNNLVVTYEYVDRLGFGSVTYIIALEK